MMIWVYIISALSKVSIYVANIINVIWKFLVWLVFALVTIESSSRLKGGTYRQLPELLALIEEKRATTIWGALPISGQILENILRSRALLGDISRVLHVTHCYLVKSEILKDYTFPPSDPDKTLVEDSIWFSNQLIESVTLFLSL